jgi:hypothetical protein
MGTFQNLLSKIDYTKMSHKKKRKQEPYNTLNKSILFVGGSRGKYKKPFQLDYIHFMSSNYYLIAINQKHNFVLVKRIN